MWDADEPRLPEWIQEAYDRIVAHVDDPEAGFSRERALEILLAQEDFDDEPADAEYAIEQLLEHGWFYEVDGELRVTDPSRDTE